MKKKAPQDLTLRNVQAVNKRLKKMADAITALKRRVKALEAAVGRGEHME